MNVPVNRSVKISHSLRILELSRGASAAEIRSAFRRLARTSHPDVAGKGGARRFEQIAAAYAFLKGLSPEELGQKPPEPAAPSPAKGRWRNPFVWKKAAKEEKEKKVSHEAPHAQPSARFSEETRGPRGTEERKRRARILRVEALLNRAEQAVQSCLERRTRAHSIRELLVRLSSERPQVRHLALARLGAKANESEVLEVLISLLRHREVDEKTARLVTALPLDKESLRKLARSLADRASALPSFFLAHVLRLYVAEEPDRELLEHYLQTASPDGVVLLLRRWPQGPFLSPQTLQRLLARESETVLLPLLGMMKQRDVPRSAWVTERLRSLAAHPSPSLRAWSKALLPQDG